MAQELEIVKAYSVAKNEKGGTVVVVIPKRIREKSGFLQGQRFSVTLDEKRRIVYAPVQIVPTL